MQPGVAGGIVDVQLAVVPRDGAVGEHHVGHVAHPLGAKGRDQVAGRLGNDLPGLGQVGDKDVDHIPQAGGGVAHAVGDVQPALFGLDGRRALAVLGLGDGVVAPGAGDDLLVDDRVGDIVTGAKADAAARTGVDKVVHRPGEEGVLAVHKAGQQIDVALLGAVGGDQVGQALPGFQVVGAHDARRRHRGGEVGVGRVLALGAEHAVDPAVLVPGQPHVVDVGLFGAGVGQLHRLVPEAEAVHGGIALGHRKKALAVAALHAGDKIELAVQLDGAGVEHRVDAQPLHKMGVGFGVQVVPPDQRGVVAGQHRVFPAVIDAVVKIGLFVFAGKQRLLAGFLAQVFGVQFTLGHRGPSSSVPGTGGRCGRGISTARRWAFSVPAGRCRPGTRTTRRRGAGPQDGRR